MLIILRELLSILGWTAWVYLGIFAILPAFIFVPLEELLPSIMAGLFMYVIVESWANLFRTVKGKMFGV